MMKLYGTPPTRAIRALWLINELDLACEVIPVDIPAGEHHGEAFRTINPLGKIPALLDGDLVIAESAAIMMHLAEVHGRGRFIPTDSRLRAEMHQWMFYLATEIEQPLWRSALHSAIYPEDQRVPGDIACAERDCRRMLQPLEAHMADREVFVGSDLTVADFMAAYTLDWTGFVGWLDTSPNLSRFVERMYARPEAPPRIEEGFAFLQRGEFAPNRRAEIGRKNAPLRA
ncbi:glutathione S-transferase family protein [Fulvimarina sp. MAC8]|uniref:glutathione S-transferase family protein n=1 Tax=Fulvimarina sp. MAC8 TaxID=3162874 RepID=UPI0032EFADD0